VLLLLVRRARFLESGKQAANACVWRVDQTQIEAVKLHRSALHKVKCEGIRHRMLAVMLYWRNAAQCDAPMQAVLAAQGRSAADLP
jgi:hypothetical protein